MWEHIPSIIEEAAKSPLGIWALVIIASGILGFAFFRRAPTAVKAGIFVFMFVGFGLFGLAASRVEPVPSKPGPHKPEPSAGIKPSAEKPPKEKRASSSPAARLLRQAREHSLADRNDQARAAYGEARLLYKQVQNRLGEANVLLGMGDLERKLGRNDEAREAYGGARLLYKQVHDRLGEANVLSGLGDLESELNRNDQARAAYGEARLLYKQVHYRLGEANVLHGLGRLESKLGRNNHAREHYHQAAYLYGAMGMDDWQEQSLRSARALDDKSK
jgi:tetratricopeptide (TPR) repeat protein